MFNALVFPVYQLRGPKITRRRGGDEQSGHLIRPFSLHAVHDRNPIFSENTLWLPLHSAQSINLYPPHVSHVPGFLWGTPETSFLSSPISWRYLTSSAPPTYLPQMKTLGNVSSSAGFNPSSSRSSEMKPKSIAKSLSSTTTWKPCNIDMTARHASNVGRTTRRLV